MNFSDNAEGYQSLWCRQIDAIDIYCDGELQFTCLGESLAPSLTHSPLRDGNWLKFSKIDSHLVTFSILLDMIEGIVSLDELKVIKRFYAHPPTTHTLLVTRTAYEHEIWSQWQHKIRLTGNNLTDNICSIVNTMKHDLKNHNSS